MSAVGLFVIVANGLGAPPSPAALQPIFNGTDLSEWTDGGGWEVRDGALRANGITQLLHRRSFGDIELTLEYQAGVAATANVSVRGHSGVTLPRTVPGPWSPVRVIQVGERLWAWIDGKPIAFGERSTPADRPLPKVGPITLTATGAVAFRNVAARELPSEDALVWLRSREENKYEQIFNGRDLTGWAGPVAGYEARNGVLGPKPDKGGTIYTTAEYGDFAARVEFRFPPGGNNGLAIRYPGKGDTAYLGMCEIQIIDDDFPDFGRMDARRYTGSAYGMVAAKRGYLRPASGEPGAPSGDWNFMEVTVVGSEIDVELNGTRILSTDLSAAKDFVANREHPGKDRTQGHFGLAGGGRRAVYFRNIAIRSLGP